MKRIPQTTSTGLLFLLMTLGTFLGGCATHSSTGHESAQEAEQQETFVTLEDETGYINLIVWKKIADEQRNELLTARLLGIEGELQKEGKVIHVIARKLRDHSELLGELSVKSRNFR